MSIRFIPCLLVVGLCHGLRGAVLPPEKLLPRDTVLVVTAPDIASARNIVTNLPYNRLWRDPALKPFKDKFVSKFSSDLIAPLERTLGVPLSSYTALAQGQATFVFPEDASDKSGNRFAKVILLDTKDRAAQLGTNLAEIRQKWAAAGKPMKTQKIRDVDFTTLVISATDLSWEKIMPKARDAGTGEDSSGPASTNKTQLTFGQADSLLLVSDSIPALEKILSREQGGLLPALEEEPSFQNDFAARLRGSPFYAWINVKSSIKILTTLPAGESDDGSSGSKLDGPLAAFGLSDVTSASLSYRSLPEGLLVQFFVGIPEGKRRGLFKALAFEGKDANPPAFIPADAVKFWRWRINISHAWSQIETMINDFNPQYATLLNYVLQSAGKDKDEHYDLKSELLANLGDDIIHYEKVPHGNTLADLNSAPSLFLIGSPNPEKLAAALKNGLGIMGAVKDREFLGRQILTLTTAAQGAMPSHSFSFAGSGGYVAMSSDGGAIEEYLRSNENKGKPLSDTPGMAEAAQRVGGMGTGLFGFDNQSMAMRAVLEALRQQPVTLQDILGAPTTMGGINTGDQAAKLRDWADFSLLPPFDAMSQYFYFSVFAGGFSSDGFAIKYFAPVPPKLR